MQRWDEIADKSYIRSLDELQICEVADHYKVPPSWVKAQMSMREIAKVLEFRQIKSDRIDEATATASTGTEDAKDDEAREGWDKYMTERSDADV